MRFIAAYKIIVIVMLPFLLGGMLVSADNNLRFHFYEDEAIADSSIKLSANETKRISIMTAGNKEVKSISGELKLDLNQLSIVNLNQNLDFCEFWDEPLSYKGESIRFLCGRSDEIEGKYLGELFSFELFTNGNIVNRNLTISNIQYQNSSGEIINVNQDYSIVINKAESILGDSTQISGTGTEISSTTVFMINLILVFSLIITAGLGYRYYRLINKPNTGPPQT